jgi:ribosomal protein L11 methyltransferase
LADTKLWPALVLQSGTVLPPAEEEAIAAFLDDYQPSAIQDLTALPLPPGGLWDPTLPPPDAPPAPLHCRVFFPAADIRDDAERALIARFPQLRIARDDVPDEDWAARSQQSLKSVRAGRFIVAPPWDVPLAPGDATVVIIEPSRGFGTGHHASTRLCLRAMSEIDVGGKRVLDVGTGSGVLAMAAFVRGARDVVAVDVDPDAIDSARESARLNPRIGRIHWMVGDFRDRGWDALSGGPFDFVLANLTGGMLRASAGRIRELVRRDGILICSGFDADEWPAVEDALGLGRVGHLVEDGWVALTLQAVADPSGVADSSPR